MIQVKYTRIVKPRPRRSKRPESEHEANVALRANVSVARARNLADRLRALAHDVDLALEQ